MSICIKYTILRLVKVYPCLLVLSWAKKCTNHHDKPSDPLKPEIAHFDMDQKVPKTIQTSVYTPHRQCLHEKVSDVPGSRGWFASKNLATCRMHKNDFLIGQIIAKCIAFQICMTCYRQKSAVWPEKLIESKKKPKTAFFCGRIWASPNFGKIWRPNCWHLVNH